MSSAESVLQEIEERSRSEYLPIVGRERGAFLEQLARDHRPCRVVEVGVLVGYATIRIARNLGAGCEVIGIEIGEDLARRAEANLLKAGLADKAVIVRGDARERLSEVPAPVDMVVLDAEKSQYLNSLKKLESKLNPGAVVAALGVGPAIKAAKGYLKYVRESGRYSSSSREFGDDIVEVSIYKGS